MLHSSPIVALMEDMMISHRVSSARLAEPAFQINSNMLKDVRKEKLRKTWIDKVFLKAGPL